jgi:hypothetical protein
MPAGGVPTPHLCQRRAPRTGPSQAAATHNQCIVHDSGPNGSRLTSCFFFICTWEVRLGFYVLPVTVLSPIPLFIKPRIRILLCLQYLKTSNPIEAGFEDSHVVATLALGPSCVVAWSFIGLAPILTQACGTAHVVYRVNDGSSASLESL